MGTPAPTSPNPSTGRVLITGGCGFLGFRLATALAAQRIQSVLLDLTPPIAPLPPGVTFVPGSVADAAAVDAAFSAAALNDSVAYGSATVGRRASPVELRPMSPGDSTGGGSCGAGGNLGNSGGCGLDAVFHVASYGMSGRELRNVELITAVNVGGTQHVLDACVRHGVPRLVYVSTCNVIFVGRPIHGGDESAPYPPASAYKDAYSATKAQAERLVLAASGTPLRRGGGGGVLRTCAVRSTGIWGPGETRHQPRVIRMVRAGLFVATFGARDSLSDWIHVENLVQLLILAERGLQERPGSKPDRGASDGGGAGGEGGSDGEKGDGGDGDGNGGGHSGPVAAGQVYYASDGSPINNFLHFKPFIVGLDYHYPALNAPYGLVHAIAALIEYCWPLLQYLVTDPPLTRMEVDKCAVTHWFSIDKARQELGYAPRAYDRAEVVGQMRAAGWAAGARGREQGERGTKAAWAVEGMGVRLAVGALLVAVVLTLYARYGSGAGPR